MTVSKRKIVSEEVSDAKIEEISLDTQSGTMTLKLDVGAEEPYLRQIDLKDLSDTENPVWKTEANAFISELVKLLKKHKFTVTP